MKAKVMYIESAGEFSKPEKTRIQKLVMSVSSDVSKTLGISKPVNVTFYRFGKKQAGVAQAKDWVMITIPKGKIDYPHLKAILYHELHHVARGYTEYLEKGNHYLLNSLFSEGLAMTFEMGKAPNKKRADSCRYSKALLRRWLPDAKKELRAKMYDYKSWFQGKGKPDRLGYRIGKYLVDEIKTHHPRVTDKNLVRKDAKELLRLSEVRF